MTKLRTFRMGASYYPERWERERWPVDAGLMREAGLDFMRTGEFAWSRFEPRDGKFDFEWMDEAIDVFAAGGISTILCTPTASPLPWMYARHPGMTPVNAEGQPFQPGERRHYCYNNPDFRRYADRVTEAMAQHYASNPHIIGWQIDNELGGEEFICYCACCRSAFRQWLEAQYGSVAELNRRWGGVFFSLEFTDWQEIPLPMGHNVTFFNPSMKLDYQRFASDSMRDFLLAQYRILKRYIPEELPVTTNRFSLFWTDKLDHRMDRELDVVAFDNYDLELSLAAFHHDFYRSLKPERPYWVLEQHTGLREWGSDPDEVRLQAIQSYLRGAELVCLFSWRQINYGVEQDFYGVVEYDGSPEETYGIIKAAAEWLREEEARLGMLTLRQETAILHSYDSAMMRHVNHLFSSHPYHQAVYERFYAPLFELGAGADFLFDTDRLTDYKAVIIPLHLLADEAALSALEAYVASGGTAIATGDLMHKSADNWRVYDGMRERLERLSGLRHRKLLFMPEDPGKRIRFHRNGTAYTCEGFLCRTVPVEKTFAEASSAQSAPGGPSALQVLAVVEEPASERGVPLVVRHTFGAGVFITLASLPEPAFVRSLLAELLPEAGVDIVDLPRGAELLRFYDAQGRLADYTLINKSGAPLTRLLPGMQEPVTVADRACLRFPAGSGEG